MFNVGHTLHQLLHLQDNAHEGTAGKEKGCVVKNTKNESRKQGNWIGHTRIVFRTHADCFPHTRRLFSAHAFFSFFFYRHWLLVGVCVTLTGDPCVVNEYVGIRGQTGNNLSGGEQYKKGNRNEEEGWQESDKREG